MTTSTAQTIVINATNDLGSVLAGIIPVILVILVSLLALGMGIRYVRKHISGRGEWTGAPIDRAIHAQNKKDGLF